MTANAGAALGNGLLYNGIKNWAAFGANAGEFVRSRGYCGRGACADGGKGACRYLIILGEEARV